MLKKALYICRRAPTLFCRACSEVRPDVLGQVIPGRGAVHAEATCPYFIYRGVTQPTLDRSSNCTVVLETVVLLQPVQTGKEAITIGVGATKLKFGLVHVTPVPSPFVATMEKLVAMWTWEWRAVLILCRRGV